jgi:catalase
LTKVWPHSDYPLHEVGRLTLDRNPDDKQRDRPVSNIVGHLKKGVSEPVLQRAFEYWRNIDIVPQLSPMCKVKQARCPGVRLETKPVPIRGSR